MSRLTDTFHVHIYDHCGTLKNYSKRAGHEVAGVGLCESLGMGGY